MAMPLRFCTLIGVLSSLVVACRQNGPDASHPGSDAGTPAVDGGVTDGGVPPLIGGYFTYIPNALPRQAAPIRSVLGDCNGDGLLDVVRPGESLVFEAKSDGTFVQHPIPGSDGRAGFLTDLDGDGVQDLVLAQNDLTIRKGIGDCTFEPDPLPHERVVCPTFGNALAVRVQDVDQDGLDDIITSCTGPIGAEPYAMHLARGDGTYQMVPIAGDGLDEAPKTGLPVFNTFFHDLDGDGILDGVFLSDARSGWFGWGVAADVPTFVRDDSMTATIAAINPMSVAPIDFDRDGRLELFGSGEQYTALLLGASADRKIIDHASSAGLGIYAGIFGDFWSALAFDADYDGWMDLFVLKMPLNLQPDDLHQAPGQPSLFLNRGDGTFADVALATPALVEGIQMACGDLRSEGRMSCFVDGDTTTSLLRNDAPASHPWIGLRLRGTVSGLSGAGAVVSVDGAEPPRISLSGTQAGTYTNYAPDLLLAASGETTDITITWPSGVQQHVKDLEPNTYTTVEEPEAVRLSRRIASADGASTIEVVVDPKVAGATTAAIALSGSGTWLGEAAVMEDGTTHRTLTAPGEPGTARVTVLLDGKPLRVRPRVRFE